MAAIIIIIFSLALISTLISLFINKGAFIFTLASMLLDIVGSLVMFFLGYEIIFTILILLTIAVINIFAYLWKGKRYGV